MSHTSDRASRLAAALMAALAAIAFSGKAIIVKLAYRHGVDAITLLALRMLFAAPLFVTLALWASRDGAATLHRHDFWKIVFVGLLGYYAASVFDFLGLQYITVALERLVLYVYPSFVLLYAVLFTGKRFSSRDGFALAMSYSGIILVFLNDLTTQQTNVVLGTFWILLSALTFSAYFIGSGHLLQRIGSVRFASFAALAATAGMLVHFFLTRDPIQLIHQPPAVYGWAALMASVSTVLPIVLTAMSIRRLGPSPVALIGIIGPVGTVFLGFVFLDEPITAIQLGGAGLTTAGVVIIGLSGKSASRKVEVTDGSLSAPRV